ncbi:MAG: DNA methyltransferase, partial [Thermodesulfobacteriota bacterium]
LGKYREKIQTIYIDPPFNKETEADYLHSVKYKDSTWISMLENRLWLAKNILKDTGSIFLRCDYNGNMFVRMLMSQIVGELNFRNEIEISRRKFQMIGGETFSNRTETLCLYSKSEKLSFNKIRRKIENPSWKPLLHLPGDRKRSERYVQGIKILPPKGRHFGISQQSLDIAFNEGRVTFNGKGQVEIFVDSEELNNNWTDIEGYSFGWDFSTENSGSLLKRVIESSSFERDIVIDFFLGSGTTTAVAQKLKRKWIGVEMGENFHGFDTEKGPSGILIRMKEVLAGKGNHEACGISKEVGWQGGGFFKCQTLEQYEDALDNLELKPNEAAQKLFKDDYLLKYFLEFETQDSPNLLNIEHLKNPFSYKLKVNFEEVGEPVEAEIHYIEPEFKALMFS